MNMINHTYIILIFFICYLIDIVKYQFFSKHTDSKEYILNKLRCFLKSYQKISLIPSV